ncbi:DUF6631 family protein [Candidatus Symbiopectobacterium sp. NZEC135]|uniref:DUF6631 family protein n=1 Tax=Candidatus Symbiopectobacterium sp. NZEC135 TaxID=2820471 RepID=UPI002225D4D6|nr:DUF6631 family protein [Candidatus Symbiopectobacterium sp. NZEC135]MCW2478831.1 hypothetical protein [Candidatus Symbiopectobacterium sp. NZEC135]
MSTSKETQSDLETLIPERTLTIAGETVTVREYSLMDSLELHAPITQLVSALAEVMKLRAMAYDEVAALLAQHASIIPVLIARSVDKPVEWVAALPAQDGTTLLDWFWTVNRHFFTSAAVRRLTILAAQAAQSEQSDLDASSPRSSEKDTTPNASATTPADS